ncbi:MAG: phosphoribosyltransferase [Armatimonadetes bacterium]|nr:phosphoribosyltransferase [Armatimonadota bacterium]
MNEFGRAPIPLAREIDPDALASENPCDALHILGSFWPNTRSSIESRVVKSFKECCPVSDHKPYISALCEFYSESIMQVLHNEKPNWVVRALSSSETEMDATRPQSLLIDKISHRIGAKDATNILFKSGARPPMRMVSHLSGPEALRTRIRYAAQDLFIRPSELGGAVLLIDDIMNTGASIRVYASALRRYAGVKRIICVNLAVTRFNRGKDGHGMLKLDMSPLEGKTGLEMVWLDPDGDFHRSKECEKCKKNAAVEMRFMAERKAKPCLICFEAPNVQKKWWQIW